jgi:hypothetical protein
MAGVAAVLDKGLRGRPFVIRGATGGRAVAADVSPEAIQAGIVPGMALTLAERKAIDLATVAPNPPAYRNSITSVQRFLTLPTRSTSMSSMGNLLSNGLDLYAVIIHRGSSLKNDPNDWGIEYINCLLYNELDGSGYNG